jgi:hypothetical protein
MMRVVVCGFEKYKMQPKIKPISAGDATICNQPRISVMYSNKDLRPLASLGCNMIARVI